MATAKWLRNIELIDWIKLLNKCFSFKIFVYCILQNFTFQPQIFKSMYSSKFYFQPHGFNPFNVLSFVFRSHFYSLCFHTHGSPLNSVIFTVDICRLYLHNALWLLKWIRIGDFFSNYKYCTLISRIISVAFSTELVFSSPGFINM